ncbi:hypothetical protein BpHYR1_023170 [Brachionus plicatilis]|uniref:Uncharacterized protein n=1 Tax=Brachionus plicatilis TaxID=10195 RepID=A0A3M7Q1Y0_BRAPC|nr:hypothetical protein BpHYR1_023170 [Brachionus plicatilis]
MKTLQFWNPIKKKGLAKNEEFDCIQLHANLKHFQKYLNYNRERNLVLIINIIINFSLVDEK